MAASWQEQWGSWCFNLSHSHPSCPISTVAFKLNNLATTELEKNTSLTTTKTGEVIGFSQKSPVPREFLLTCLASPWKPPLSSLVLIWPHVKLSLWTAFSLGCLNRQWHLTSCLPKPRMTVGGYKRLIKELKKKQNCRVQCPWFPWWLKW